ncbi:MAG: vWA domain-containing protein [Myxococcales bacterium]|nr:vWA domain-containing protein [Myxococcales bacterium]
MRSPTPKRRSPARVHLTALACALSSVAFAAPPTPADVLVLVDSSGSMRKPLGNETRLDAARKLATEVIKAAQASHHVGLVRFAQLDTVVQGGEGLRVTHAEDRKQCERGSNLLTPLSSVGASQALRWLDGVEALGNPELVALGDSPLGQAVEGAIGYLRNKRVGDPRRHCVNAYVVVITDGEDTCAGGGDLRARFAALAEQAQREDFHLLVLSYTEGAEAAAALAKIGQSDPNARPFGATEGQRLVDAVKAIQGRLAPEACLASGVTRRQLGLEPAESEADAGCAEPTTTATGCGCALGSGAQSHGPGLLIVGALLAVATLRRLRARRALVVGVLGLTLAIGLSFAGCNNGTAPCLVGGTPVAPVSTLVEPAERQDVALARLSTVLASAADTRTAVLAPILSPQAVFAAQPDADACIALARSIGLELYQGAQRGSAGCLATRRCSSLDKALLLDACLKTKGVTATLLTCTPEAAFRARLRAASLVAPTLPDLAAVVAREQALIAALFPADPDARSKLDGLLAARDRGLATFFADNVQKDVATLQPLAGLDATTTAQGVEARLEEALSEHFFLRVGSRLVDPSLAGSDAETGACPEAPAPPVAQRTLNLQVEVLVRYAGPSEANWVGAETVAAELTLQPHELFGETLSVGVADAALTSLPPGLPAPSSTGCLRAFIEVQGQRVRGAPFFISQPDATGCIGAPLVPPTAGLHLAKLVLRLTTRPMEGARPVVIERTLVDRYGFALDLRAARVAGPMYSNELGRQLLPLRVDLPLVSGLLSPAAQLDARLKDLSARTLELEAGVAVQVGLPVTPAPPGGPRLLPLTIIGAVGRYAAPQLGSSFSLVAERPWLIAHVQRRGFGVSAATLDVVEQTIVDVLDAPLLVVGASTADAAARLRAQLAVGAVVTEAEAAAVAVGEKVPVTNAGRLLRDPRHAGKWSAMDPAALDPTRFPVSVRDAAAAYTNEVLIVGTGLGDDPSAPQLAWWRLDKETGRTLSEVRYDGTFYGGAAGVKLIIDIDKCLYVAAAEALSGNETCDINPCIKKAWEDFAKNVAMDYLTGALGALGGALGLGDSLIWGLAEFTNEIVGNANDLIEGIQLPKCE